MDNVANISSLQDKPASSLVLKWRMEEQLAHYPRVLKVACNQSFGMAPAKFLGDTKKGYQRIFFLKSNEELYHRENTTKLVLQNRDTESAIPRQYLTWHLHHVQNLGCTKELGKKKLYTYGYECVSCCLENSTISFSQIMHQTTTYPMKSHTGRGRATLPLPRGCRDQRGKLCINNVLNYGSSTSSLKRSNAKQQQELFPLPKLC